MPKTALTFRASAETKKQLDDLAQLLRRGRNEVINDALQAYIDLQKWQLQHIQKALRSARAGKFVPQAQVDAFFEKLGA